MKIVTENLRHLVSLGLLICLSLLLGTILIQTIPPFSIISDYADYDKIGQSIAFERTYALISEDEIIYPPLYPMFLGAVYATFGHQYELVYLFQFLLLGGTACALYILLVRHLSVRWWIAAAAGVTVVTWPYFVMYSLVISNEVLYTFFLITGLLLLMEALRARTYGWAATAGIVMGLAALTRPVFLLLPLWIAIGCFCLHLFRIRKDLWVNVRPLLGTLLITYLAVLTPWVLYVQATYDRVIPIASNLSVVWEKGNKSLAYLSDDPAPAAPATFTSVLAAKLTNVYLFWNPGASGYQMEQLTRAVPLARGLITLYYIEFFTLLALASVTLASGRIPVSGVLLLWIVIAYTWSVHTVLFPFPRYTLPIVPLVIAAAAYAVHILVTKYTTTRTLPL